MRKIQLKENNASHLQFLRCDSEPGNNRLFGSWTETGFEEITGHVPEADFWTA